MDGESGGDRKREGERERNQLTDHREWQQLLDPVNTVKEESERDREGVLQWFKSVNPLCDGQSPSVLSADSRTQSPPRL